MTNYSEPNSKFAYKMGRSPKEILKEVNATGPAKHAFMKHNHKKMGSSNQYKKLDPRKFRANTTQESNISKMNEKSRKTREFNLKHNHLGSIKSKHQSFKSETAEFARLEYNNTGNWKTRERGKKQKGRSGYVKRAEKDNQEAIGGDCVSIYKKLDVHAISNKKDKSRLLKNAPKTREAASSKNKKKDQREQSKYQKKRVSLRHKKNSLLGKTLPVQDSIKTTPERKSQRKERSKKKTKSRETKSKSKKSRKKQSKGKSFDKKEHRSNLKRNTSKSKAEASFEKKPISRKHTITETKGLPSRQKHRKLLQAKKPGFGDLTGKISQTMGKAERTTSEMNSFHKRSLKTSRHLADPSKKTQIKEKSKRYLKNNFRSRLKHKELSRSKKAKNNLSLHRSVQKGGTLDYSRGKLFHKTSKKKNSMILKNMNELTQGMKGEVKVIYKAEESDKGRKEINKGNVKMLYQKGRDPEGEVQYLRDIPHYDANSHGMDEAPNIYNQTKGEQPLERASSKTAQKIHPKTGAKRTFRKEKSLQKRSKVTSNRKLSSMSKRVRSIKSNDKHKFKSNLKNKLAKDTKGNFRESFDREPINSDAHSSKFPTKRNKTNIYQKPAPKITFPSSEIDFHQQHVQNSIFLKTEEVKVDEGTTISEGTETTSLACKEKINLANTKRQENTEQSMTEKTFYELEAGHLDYARSEDLKKSVHPEMAKVNIGHSSGEIKLAVGKKVKEHASVDEQKREKSQIKSVGGKQKKMKTSQSDAGNSKSMIKANFMGVRSGDFNLLR